jgi:hypothetical protein
MRQSAAAGSFLYCSPLQWLIMVPSGLVVSGLAWPWYAHISGWVGVALFLMTVTVVHMIFTSKFVVCLPHIAILISGLQYVLAAWLSFYFPPDNPAYNIGANLPEYLMFGGCVTIAFALGWAVTLWGVRQRPLRTMPASPALLAELDVLFWFGLVAALASRFVQLGSLGFVLVLCANLRYVGALGRMMVSGPGWKWRVWLTLGLEVLLATQEGMFHSLLLWSACTFALYVFKTKPKRIVIFGLVCLGVLLLPALEQAKFKIREKVWSGQESRLSLFNPENFKNAVDWFGYLGNGIIKTATMSWDADFISDIAIRYNQGWIINRVMETVPSSEPYARGGTLIAAVEAAALPRVLAPNKVQAGGKANMERYAGLTLNEGTSMNLGYAGEMYANFGYWGGIAGCFCYALVLALLFRWIFNRAALNPLWWAFVPYVGLIGLKSEEGVAEVLNWIVKAAIITAAIYFIFPAIRAALSRGGKPGEARRSRFRQQQSDRAKAELAGGDLGIKEIPE